MLIKIASGQVWDTNTAGFVANKTDGQGIEELSDYQGNPANVDFLKDYLLRNQQALGILSQNQAEEEAYASLFRDELVWEEKLATLRRNADAGA